MEDRYGYTGNERSRCVCYRASYRKTLSRYGHRHRDDQRNDHQTFGHKPSALENTRVLDCCLLMVRWFGSRLDSARGKTNAIRRLFAERTYGKMDAKTMDFWRGTTGFGAV